MLKCPHCGENVSVSINITGVVELYSIIQKNSIKLVARGISDLVLGKVSSESYFCRGCRNEIPKENLVISSQLSGNTFPLNKAVIIYIKCPEQDKELNKIDVIQSPCIIGASEVERFSREFNYYEDNSLVVATPITAIVIDTKIFEGD